MKARADATLEARRGLFENQTKRVTSQRVLRRFDENRVDGTNLPDK
jgi:hypothetical protein